MITNDAEERAPLVSVDRLVPLTEELIIHNQFLFLFVLFFLIRHLKLHHYISRHEIWNNLTLFQIFVHQLFNVSFWNLKADHVVLDLS